MLRIESVLNGSEDGDVGEHLKEGKEILADLIRQATPDATSPASGSDRRRSPSSSRPPAR
jgi:hypothetical protein